MSDTIDQLNSATLAQFSEQTELETQVMDLAAPQSRKITLPQKRFITLDATQLATLLNAGISDPTQVLITVVDPGLADGAATRNVRAMVMSEFQKLVANRSKTFNFQTPPKVGTTAGWVVAAANNLGKMATIPASQAGSTLVCPIDGLKVGDIITGFYINGSIQSGGNNASILADLRALTAAAAGATDASVAVQAATLTVAANTILASGNTGKSGFTHTVVAGESYYVLITATTAAACTEEIQSIVVTVTGS